MSIVDAVLALVEQGRLIERPSLFGISARTMFVTPEIDAISQPPFADTLDGERYAALAQYFDAFSELNAITVSQAPFSKPHDVMLARVSPVEAEFWSMRIVDPEATAGMRVLGGFCDKDAFVALVCEFREDISDFGSEVANVTDVWRDYFGTIPPYAGRRLDDYLTNYYET